MSDSERAPDDDTPTTPDPSATEPTAASPSLLELVLAQYADQAAVVPPGRIDDVVVGQVAEIDPSGTPRVTFPGAPPGGLPARAMASLGANDVGRAVALMFEGGDPRRPIVMGRMAVAPGSPDGLVAHADGKRVEIAAGEELVLRCGDASITLTRSGKILIEGAYVISRSSGVNRVQGGAVEIN